MHYIDNNGKKVTLRLKLSESEKKRRKKEREERKKREEEARKMSIESFNKFIESGVLVYVEGDK